MSEMVKRERWLDCVRGIAILLVILGHIGASEGVVQNWIYSFHMPLFFCITGYLSMNSSKKKEDSFGAYVLKKAGQLLWPYLTYGALRIIYLLCLQQFAEIGRMVWQTVTLQGYSVLWFLYTLFFAELIYYFYRKMPYLYQGILAGILIVMTSLVSWGNYHGVRIGDLVVLNSLWINMINRVGIAIVFLWMGSLFYKIIFSFDSMLDSKMKKRMVAGICLVLFCLNMYFCQLNSIVDLHFGRMNQPVWYWFFSIVSSFTLMYLTKIFIRENTILEFFGKNSLSAMCVSSLYPVIDIAIILAGFTGLSGGFYLLLVWVLAVTATGIGTEVIRRFFSFFNRFPYSRRQHRKV